MEGSVNAKAYQDSRLGLGHVKRGFLDRCEPELPVSERRPGSAEIVGFPYN
jgi:hypothetical protein